jgi:hypothetical protein
MLRTEALLRERRFIRAHTSFVKGLVVDVHISKYPQRTDPDQ